MADQKKLCVMTVHGIGFQQPPKDGLPGYADTLHSNLRTGLGGRLGSDPERPTGPVYVMSAKPGTSDKEWGLSRLRKPLTGGEPIAHVALVYSSLEGAGPPPGAGAGAVVDASLILGHYASVSGTAGMVLSDVWAALPAHGDQGPASSPSLRPRTDLPTAGRHYLARLIRQQPGSPGLLGTVRALEDDVVAYVCRNDLRERVREFIAEALGMLLARDDVDGVIVNAHSQGTVACFDVLRQLAAEDAARVRLVTSGSPLRKYADMLFWGTDAGVIRSMGWLNFWDEHDPVADRLDPPAGWQPGQPVTPRPKGQPGLFWAPGGGQVQAEVPIRDIQVDNLANSSGGGLQAHNYWDNAIQFIPELCGLL